MFVSVGTARWAYNWTLGRQIENYNNGGKFIKDKDLRKGLTVLKKTEEYSWLNKYSNNITKQAVKDACEAYKKFFKKLSNFPKFKSRKKSKPSFYHDTEKIKFKDGRVRIEKVGWIKLSEKTRIPENVKYTTPRVTFDGLNWFISVGIDVRLKDLAICSNIEKPFKNINKTSKVRKLEKQIKRVCNHLDNIRTNYRHQTTIEIVKTKPSQIVVENLNISGMMKNRHLSKAIWQQGLYDFKSILKSYK